MKKKKRIKQLQIQLVSERKEFGAYIDALKDETKNLRADLIKLEDEADEMGIDSTKREEKIKELYASLTENTTTTQSMVDEMNARFSEITDLAKCTITLNLEEREI